MTYHMTRLGGLGAIASFSASPHIVSDRVKALQRDLVTLGLLPSSGVDGLLGPNTQTAVTRAALSLSLPQDATHTMTYSATLVRVPGALLDAIHAAALAAGTTPGATPPPAVSPSPDLTLGPGDQAVLDQAQQGGAAAPAAGGGSTMKWVLIGAGGLALVGVVVMFARQKPAAASAAVKANRRRMRKNLFGFGGSEPKGHYEDPSVLQVRALRHVLSGHANLHGAAKATRARELVQQIGRRHVPADLLAQVDALQANRRRARRRAA